MGHAADDALISLYFIRFGKEIKQQTAAGGDFDRKEPGCRSAFPSLQPKNYVIDKGGFLF